MLIRLVYRENSEKEFCFVRQPVFSPAATLEDVVEFYDRRFQIGLSQREKQDLVHFLRVL